MTLIICTICSAQNYQWAVGEGGILEDKALGITTDDLGNVYVTGFFKSTAAFGSTTFTSAGVADIFLAKYDSAGNLLWAKQFGGISNDIGYDVATDASGNCYLTGSFRQTATFGSIILQSTGSDGNYDAFLLKTDAQGNVLWAKKGGGADWDEARGLALTGNQIYITGLFTGPATFGSFTVEDNDGQDVYVACYTTDGNINWVSTGGGPNSDLGLGLASDAQGNAFITGYFQGQATFGNEVISNASSIYLDAFTVKISASGTFLWARSGGVASDDDVGRAVTTDSSGNVYIAGDLRGSGQFDGINYTSAGIADIFVVKYDTAGNIQYLTQAGNQGGDYAYGIAAANNNIYITGSFNGIVPFGDTVLTSAGSFGPISNDIFFASMDANTGNFTKALRAGGNGDDEGNAIAADFAGNLYQAGDFEHNNSSFTPFVLQTNGVHDIFVARINQAALGTYNVSEKPKFFMYPNPVVDLCQIMLTGNESNDHLNIDIYSCTFQLLKSMNTHDNPLISLDVSDFAAGIYYVHFVDEEKSSRTLIKLIKR